MSQDNTSTWVGPFIVMENIKTYDLANHERVETRFVKLDARAIQEGLVKEIGISETVVLLLLASFSDMDKEAYPSQRAIAEMTGLSLPTVNRVVNDLLKKEINGKPILTRSFMMNNIGRKFSVYRLNTLDYSTGREEPNKATTDRKAAIDNMGAEVSPEGPEIGPKLGPEVNHEVKHEVGPKGASEGDLEGPEVGPEVAPDETHQVAPKVSPEVDPEVAPAKKKTARDHVFHFRSKFEDAFGIPYIVSYGRDTTMIKTKLMPNYSEADIEYLIDYTIDHYKQEWANDKYPYPSIVMLTTWIANSVMQKRKQDQEKHEELKEILEATKGYENESYESFDRL